MDANDKKLIQLLERWQSGDFTRADEQELQRLLAESDGFGREATDGILSFPEEDHKKRIAAIRKRLPYKNDRPAAFFSGRMLALAASFALLLVAVWWMMSPGNADKKVAVSAPESQHESVITDAANEDATTAITQRPNIAEDRAMSPGGAAKAGKSSDPGIARLKSPEIAPGAAWASDTEAKQRGGAIQSTVLAKKESQTEEAELLDDKLKMDSALGFVAAKPVESEGIPRSFDNAIYRPAAEEHKSESFEQSPNNIPRVSPVNSYPNPPATASNTGKAATKKSKTVTAPTPAGGWSKFRNEMSRDLKLPQAARDNGLNSGKVSMIIDIGRLDGKIKSVIFTSRFGYGCDELAEQFVQKYNWVVMPGGPTEVEVDILFK